MSLQVAKDLPDETLPGAKILTSNWPATPKYRRHLTLWLDWLDIVQDPLPLVVSQRTGGHFGMV